jgi:hypothetical protein
VKTADLRAISREHHLADARDGRHEAFGRRGDPAQRLGKQVAVSGPLQSAPQLADAEDLALRRRWIALRGPAEALEVCTIAISLASLGER